MLQKCSLGLFIRRSFNFRPFLCAPHLIERCSNKFKWSGKFWIVLRRRKKTSKNVTLDIILEAVSFRTYKLTQKRIKIAISTTSARCFKWCFCHWAYKQPFLSYIYDWPLGFQNINNDYMLVHSSLLSAILINFIQCIILWGKVTLAS